MSILSDSGERTGEGLEPTPADPPARTDSLSPGWVLARRCAQVASPIVVALLARWVSRLS